MRSIVWGHFMRILRAFRFQISLLAFSTFLLVQDSQLALGQQTESGTPTAAEISAKLEATTKLATEISSELKALQNTISKLNDDILEINQGLIFKLKDGKPAKTTVEYYDKQLAEIKKADSKHKEILSALDAILAQLVTTRFNSDGSFAANNDPLGFLKEFSKHANLMFSSPKMRDANARANETDRIADATLEQLQSAISEFRAASAPTKPPTNGEQFVMQAPQVGGLLEKHISDQGSKGMDDAVRAKASDLAKILVTKLIELPDLKEDKNPIKESGSLKTIATYSDKLEATIKAFDLKGDLEFIGKQAFIVENKLPNSLEKLRTAIDGYLANDKLVIKIEQATVGDTFGKSYTDCLNLGTGEQTADCAFAVLKKYRKNWRGSRWCDASEPVRHYCNRKGSCEFTGDTAKVLPADYASRLCGYNPAPSAAPQNRGLHVFYQCVSNLKSNFEDGPRVVSAEWDDAACDPKSPQCQDRVRYGSADMSQGRMRYALLRQGGQITCDK